jgi:hypothetical protein
MSPPTEQLIRDYLNRLSVAARGRLNAEDRRALVTLTHDFIERSASESGPPTAMKVAALLSRLGDPGALVEQEAARLAEARGGAAAPAEVERSGRLLGLLRRRNTPLSWHWPAAPGSPGLLRELLSEASAQPVANGVAQEGHNGSLAVRVPRQPGPQAGEVPGEVPATDRAAAAGDEEPSAVGPGWPSAPKREGSPQPGAGVAEPREPEAGAAEPSSAEAGPAEADAGELAADLEQDPAAAGSVRGWLASVANRALAGSRRTPMEATAVILLGLGGVIYPPVWLLGACLALASKVWDYRDKWAGLVGPVVIMIIGTATCLALGTSQSGFGPYLHQTWVYLNIWSRVGAVAGTWYLVWRLAHDRETPDVPPWSRPRRVD